MSAEEGRESPAIVGRRWSAVAVFAAHGVVSVLWCGLMPQGFSPDHPRFWSNLGLPVLALAASAWGIGASLLRRDPQVRLLLAAFGLFWTAAFLSARVLFPVSAQAVWLPGLAVGLTLAAGALPGGRVRAPALGWALLTSALVTGSFLPWTQRAPDSATHPVSTEPPQPDPGLPADPEQVKLNGGLRLMPGSSLVLLEDGPYSLQVEPLLTFISRSPDRCWTNLAPPAVRQGPLRRLRGWSRETSLIEADYEDDGASRLEVRSSMDGEASIEADSYLPWPVYSHLNTWCRLRLTGHRRLTVVFSPCASAPVEVLPSDYPAGRPARFAYLSRDGAFRVVEASSGEKGPFRTLAVGRVGSEEPLVLTLADEGRPILQLRFQDWARQASTQLSPTAGWGVPVNAIEFALGGNGPDAPAKFFFTLAGTSVGRGWDSVGHRAGTYRNRLGLRWLQEE